MSGRILLDDPSHAGGSDQLLIGTVANDGTGDPAHTGGAKLKQWAADLNTMTAELFGGGGSLLNGYATVTASAGAANNVTPTVSGGTWPLDGNTNPVMRLDVNTNAGNAEWTGLTAGVDGQMVLICNTGSNNLQLDIANTGSSAANRFRGSGTSLTLGPGARTWAVYYGGSINLWSIG